MDISVLSINLWSILIILVVIWAYFFIYSYRRHLSFPWGFGIVILGLRLAGLEVGFQNSQVAGFSVDLPFLVCLFGMLWNINNIREQFHVQRIEELLRYIGIGVVLGILFGISLSVLTDIDHFQNFARYTSVELVASSILASVGEELLFRGYFLSYLRKYGFKPEFAIVFQSLVFTVGHVSHNSGNWVALGIIFLFGITAGFFTWKSNNLISAFVLHIVINLTPVIWWLAMA